MEFPRGDAPDELEGDLEFQVIDWYVPENDKSRQKREQAKRRDQGGYVRPECPRAPAEYEIFMFGTTAEGYTVTAKVVGYQPYFYVKVPDTWTMQDKKKLQTALFKEVEQVTFRGDKYMAPPIKKSLKDHLVKIKLVERKDFWGFTNEADFKFLQIVVKSLRLFNDLKRYFGDDARIKEGFQLYESNIDPFLRFIHERGIQPCGWVRVPEDNYKQLHADDERERVEKENEKISEDIANRSYNTWLSDYTPCVSRTQYSVEVTYDSVYGLTYNKIAPLLIASFDIECTSSHGDFPVAVKDYRKLTIDLIAMARSINVTKDMLIEMIPAAYAAPVDVQGNTINRLYAQKSVKSTEHIRTMLQPLADKIIRILHDIVKVGGAGANSDGEDSDDDAIAVAVVPAQQRGRAQALELELNTLFVQHLPKLKGDAIIQIGTTVHRYGSDEIVYRHITTLKSCDDMEGVHVEPRGKEAEIILAWKEIIQELDPDIITGYNIFGFDAKYIADRAIELGIYDEFVKGLGRLSERYCDIEERKLSSSALGDNIMYCFDLDGVVQIDMLKVMQRDHKLDSYKLDHVAGKFVVESGVMTGPSTIRADANGVRQGDFIRIDPIETKLQIVAICDGIITVDAGDTVLPSAGSKIVWGVVKDDITPNEIFAKYRQGPMERMQIAKYCLQDCVLVNRLLHKIKVLENNIGMGNVCYVPLNFLFMRGQGVKIFSLVARECRLKRHLIPVVRSARDVLEDEVGYEGAIVLPPQEGMYLDDPITVLDYSSLYPSSMIARNLSHDALVIDPSYKEAVLAGGSSDVTFQDITFDEYEGVGDKKRIKGQKTCTFAQFKDGRKAIIPSILQMLLTQRKNTRKKIEYETVNEKYTGLVKEVGDSLQILDVDSGLVQIVPMSDVRTRRDSFNEFEKAVLDARQLAYKITANSLYGQTGSRTSPIYLLEVAACTTATGREMIMLAKGFVEREYGAEVIYGDSVANYTPVYVRHENTFYIMAIEMVAKVFGDDKWMTCSNGKESCELPGVETWSDVGWTPMLRVIRHKLAPNKKMVRITTPTSVVVVTDDHSLLNPKGYPVTSKDVCVGAPLMHRDLPTGIEATVADESNSHVQAAHQFWLKSHECFKPTIQLDGDGKMAMYSGFVNHDINSITSMDEVRYSCDEYVYDLTTGNHHFAAGVGRMIVHNTDSIFCKFPNEGKKGREALPLAIASGQRASREIKALLPPPQCLEYEKTLWPFILFSKKRYVGNLYEDDHNKKPKQKSMGIVLKRRDNAQIVKIVYGGIIDILMKGGNLEQAVEFLSRSLQELVNGNVSMEQLVISKTLKGNYKDPTKIAHKVLAERIGERDPGNKPMVNDRVPFVYIVAPPGSKLQGDRIESPDYIRDMHLKPDYQFYITNQLMKPITQLFSLCVEQLPGYTLMENYWLQIDVELEGTAMYANEKKRKDRISRMKMKEVKDLLFDPFILPTTPTARKQSCKRITAAMQAIAALQEGNGSTGYYTLEISATEKKRGSLYDCAAVLQLHGTEEPVWKLEKTYKGRKADTLRMMAKDAFAKIAQDDALKSCAILVTCTDKAFIRVWKNALAQSISDEDSMKAVRQQLDDGLLKEQTEMVAFNGLVHARSVVNYVLQ